MAFISRLLSRRIFQKNSRRFFLHFGMTAHCSTAPMPIESTSLTQNSHDEEMETFKASLNEEKRRRLENYMEEYEQLKRSTSMMPSQLSVKRWTRLVDMITQKERIFYLTYLCEKENSKLEKKKSREQVEEIVAKKREEIRRKTEEHIYYGIGGNCLFRRFLRSDAHE